MDDLIKKQYFKKVIESIKNNTSINFPMDAEIIKNDREFLLYVDKLDELLKEYIGIRKMFDTDPVELVKFVLNHLKKYKEQKKDLEAYGITKDLFYALDYSDLSVQLQTSFKGGVELLEKTIKYFCSYTTKGLPEINSLYEVPVVNAFGVNKITQMDEWKKVNYVAKLIVRYLNDHGFNSYFFDQDKIVNGDEIKEKVFDYCERTAVLVLFAQQETFRDNEETNWCYEEYKRYKTKHGDNGVHIVYRIPNLAEPAGAREEIIKWYRYISTTEGIKSTTIERNWTNDMIRNKVNADAPIIAQASERLFSNFVFNIQ